jgi:hypothetical protein
MRPIPHRSKTETREGNDRVRGGRHTRTERPEEDDEAWLEVQEF